jgi:hypothetical protein
MMVAICWGLLMAAVALRWSGPRLSDWRLQAIVAALLLLWALLPWPWGAGSWLSAYGGSLSVTSSVLALAALAQRFAGFGWPPRRELRGLCVVVLAVVVWFWPMSLGATAMDPYAWGYGDFRFSSALLVLGLAAWMLRAWFCCLLLVLAQFAYAGNLLPSDNLWDYLLDVWLVFWCLGWLIRDLRARRREAVQSASE